MSVSAWSHLVNFQCKLSYHGFLSDTMEVLIICRSWLKSWPHTGSQWRMPTSTTAKASLGTWEGREKTSFDISSKSGTITDVSFDTDVSYSGIKLCDQLVNVRISRDTKGTYFQIYSPSLRFCRKDFLAYLRRPDHKQEFVSQWQKV